ncbi:MAG: carboxypeptidase-like regulatory domain-containing protein [Bacteroidetes bacterium]|nr:MAG: carboxypeptidase-like regulatory domain-containing protein [Bacteroidota bacterium]
MLSVFRYIAITLFILWVLPSFSNISNEEPEQDRPRRVVQFSGLVLTGDSLKPVPFTNIWVKNTRRGTITDFQGFFSIAIRELDTLRFTAVGFKDINYVIPDTLTSNRYSAIQLMTQDTIHLPETVIYPWPTREQFRFAFLNTEIPDDDNDRALRNLERAEMRERLEKMPLDGYANFRHMTDQHAQRLYYAGQRPPMRIFDPFAWSQFIQAWREGRFRRSD